MPGPNPQPRANGIVGQGVRILTTVACTARSRERRDRLSAHRARCSRPSRWTSRWCRIRRCSCSPSSNRSWSGCSRSGPSNTKPDIRWGHALTGFDQGADGVTVQVSGPDGDYELRAKYLIGADGGTSMTRKLAGIDFPGMSSHDAVARMGFDVLPPAEWIDPISGALDVPGFGRIPPLGFHRAERGVFACGALGGRAAVIVFELDRTAREHPVDRNGGEPPHEPGRTGGQPRAGHRRGGAVAAGIA